VHATHKIVEARIAAQRIEKGFDLDVDTASNLDPGDRNASGFPQKGHGSIALTNLFNDPTDKE
jgi:hypothetical protein